MERSTGDTRTSAMLRPADETAAATSRRTTLLQNLHDRPTMKALFCHMLYFGFLSFPSFSIGTSRNAFQAYSSIQMENPLKKVMKRRNLVTKCKAFNKTACFLQVQTCGMRISVVNAPSSELRLRYPSRRSTMASMLTSPKPWPSPFVVLKRPPTLRRFPTAVKLVKEM